MSRGSGGMKSAGALATAALENMKKDKESPREKLKGKRQQSSSKAGATGRIDPAGTEKVIDMGVVKKSIGELETLHGKKTQAGIAYREAVKKVAEKSGMLSSSVNALVVARVADSFDDKKRQYEQLSLLFSEVGED